MRSGRGNCSWRRHIPSHESEQCVVSKHDFSRSPEWFRSGSGVSSRQGVRLRFNYRKDGLRYMQVDKLLLSKHARTDLDRIACVLHGDLEVVGEYDIAVRCSNFTIRLYQAEKYSQLLVAVVAFVGGPSIHWQEVREALSSTPASALARGAALPSDECATNDRFMHELRESCEGNEKQLLEWPPLWLQGACNVAQQNIAQHFPDIAEQFGKDCANFLRRING